MTKLSWHEFLCGDYIPASTELIAKFEAVATIDFTNATTSPAISMVSKVFCLTAPKHIANHNYCLLPIDAPGVDEEWDLQYLSTADMMLWKLSCDLSDASGGMLFDLVGTLRNSALPAGFHVGQDCTKIRLETVPSQFLVGTKNQAIEHLALRLLNETGSSEVIPSISPGKPATGTTVLRKAARCVVVVDLNREQYVLCNRGSGIGVEHVSLIAQLRDARVPPGMEFSEVLSMSLPFKIPVLNPSLVTLFPDAFTYGIAEYESYVDTWMLRVGGSTTSEMTVTGFDLMWQSILQTLCNLVVYSNQKDPSSAISLRPDFTGMYQGILVMKSEAKADPADLSSAAVELADRLHKLAFGMFPKGCQTIPVLVTSSQLAYIHRIFVLNGVFTEELEATHNLMIPVGRKDFIVNIFKIARWIFSQISPRNEPFHLPPAVRQKTRNNHHVTLLKDGLLKEFGRHSLNRINMDMIRKVYEAKLPNVEQGITNGTSITISRVGRQLRDAMRARSDNVSKESAVASVKQAINQLHGLGISHCDICVDNVFVDVEGDTVFLGDLEYVQNCEAPAPTSLRRSDSRATNGAELDMLQLNAFQDEVAGL